MPATRSWQQTLAPHTMTISHTHHHPASRTPARHTWAALALCAALAGCQALPSPPQAVVLYDLGLLHLPLMPTATQSPTPATPAPTDLRPLVLPPLHAPVLEDHSTAMHYRLEYADPRVQHLYRNARWSQPPARLVQQRLREHLGAGGRTIVLADARTPPPQPAGTLPAVLHLTLEEFTQVYTHPDTSLGTVRLRATLSHTASDGGPRMLAQQVFTARHPAPSADAPAGAQALASSVDDIAGQLLQWLQQAPGMTPDTPSQTPLQTRQP